MKHNSKLILIILSVTAVLVVTVTATLQVRKNAVKSASLQKAEKDFYTIADNNSVEPAEPAKRVARKARERRYNMKAQKGVDPKRFAISEDRESTFSIPPTHSPVEPALPAAQADAVVVGQVTSAQAFLSEDKTDVISEFTVHVTELLKENLVSPFSIGDSLEAIRGGGGVRLGSGKVILYGAEGKPLPKIGQRYLFFLKYNNDEGKDYLIITAYGVENDLVRPLDGLTFDGAVLRNYGAYQKYDAWRWPAFLTEVRTAIYNSTMSQTRQ